MLGELVDHERDPQRRLGPQLVGVGVAGAAQLAGGLVLEQPAREHEQERAAFDPARGGEMLAPLAGGDLLEAGHDQKSPSNSSASATRSATASAPMSTSTASTASPPRGCDA